MEKVKNFLGNTRNIILGITAILGFLGTMSTGVFWVDDRYAKAEQVEQLEKRLTLAELKDQLRLALEDFYFLKSQARKYPGDLDIQKELSEAEEYTDDLKEKIKNYKD